MIADMIVVRNGFAEQHPDSVVGFLKAYARALQMYKDTPDAAAEIVAKQAGVTKEVALSDMKEYDFVPPAMQITPEWLGGTPASPGKFAHVLKGTADFLVEQHSIKSAPDVAAFQKATNMDFMKKAIG